LLVSAKPNQNILRTFFRSILGVSLAALISLSLTGCNTEEQKAIAGEAFLDAVCPYNMFIDKWEDKNVKQNVKSVKRFYKEALNASTNAWQVLSNPEITWPSSVRDEIELLATSYKIESMALQQTQSMTKMKQLRKWKWPEEEAFLEGSGERIRTALSLELDPISSCKEHLGISSVKQKKDKTKNKQKTKPAKPSQPQVQLVEVPDITGGIDGQVRTWLRNNGYKFSYDIKSTGFNPKISCLTSGRNLIVGQDPAPGSQVKNTSSTWLRAYVECEW
jgi:hypothetical protein